MTDFMEKFGGIIIIFLAIAATGIVMWANGQPGTKYGQFELINNNGYSFYVYKNTFDNTMYIRTGESLTQMLNPDGTPTTYEEYIVQQSKTAE